MAKTATEQPSDPKVAPEEDFAAERIPIDTPADLAIEDATLDQAEGDEDLGEEVEEGAPT